MSGPAVCCVDNCFYRIGYIHIDYAAQQLFLEGSKQARLLHKSVKETLAFDKLAWSVKLFDFAMVQHDNAVAIENGIDTMRNYRNRMSESA